jgi:hypothetical protein
VGLEGLQLEGLKQAPAEQAQAGQGGQLGWHQEWVKGGKRNLIHFSLPGETF